MPRRATARARRATARARRPPAPVDEPPPRTPPFPVDEPVIEAPGAPGSDSPMQAEATGTDAEAPADDAAAPAAEAPDQSDAAHAPAAEAELPTAVEGPRTVGRLIADALRSAGVRYAFTVPGESFLGLLDALGDAGIRVVATRHEGAAAFMAEAHGQLTGRPAACLGTRAVGAANLAIGIHTARQDSTPMFALVGQVETAASGARGVPGDRPGGHDRRARQVGGRADAPWTMSRRPWPRPSARRWVGGRARSCCRSPRTCSTRSCPPRRASTRAEPGPGATGRRRDPRRHRAACLGRPAGHPRRRRRPAGAHVDRAASFRGAAPGPGHRRAGAARTSSRTTTRCTSGWPGFGAPASVRDRLAAADAMLVIGCRLNEPTSSEDAIPGETTRWAHVDLDPARADRPSVGRSRGHGRRPHRSCVPRTSAWSARPCSMPSRCGAGRRTTTDRPRRLGGRERRGRRRRLVVRSGRPSRVGSSRRSATSSPTTPS